MAEMERPPREAAFFMFRCPAFPPAAAETAEVLPGRNLPLTRLPLFPGCTAFSTLASIHPEILVS